MIRQLYGSVNFGDREYLKAAKFAGKREKNLVAEVGYLSLLAESVKPNRETEFPSSLRGVLTFLFPSVNYAYRAPTHPIDALDTLKKGWSQALEQGVSEFDLLSLEVRILLRMLAPLPKSSEKLREVSNLFQNALNEFSERVEAAPAEDRSLSYDWFQLSMGRAQLDHKSGNAVLAFQRIQRVDAHFNDRGMDQTKEPSWKGARAEILSAAAHQKTDLLIREQALKKWLKDDSLFPLKRLQLLFKLIKTYHQLAVQREIKTFSYERQLRALLNAVGWMLLEVERGHIVLIDETTFKPLPDDGINSFLAELLYWEAQYLERHNPGCKEIVLYRRTALDLCRDSREGLITAVELSLGNKMSGSRISGIVTRIGQVAFTQENVCMAVQERKSKGKKRLYFLELDLLEFYMRSTNDYAAKKLAIELHEEFSEGESIKGNQALVVRLIRCLFALEESERGHQLTHQMLSTVSVIDLDIKGGLLSAVPEKYPRLRAAIYVAYFNSSPTLPIPDEEFETAKELATDDLYQSLDIVFARVMNNITGDQEATPSLIRMCEFGLTLDVPSEEADILSKIWLIETWLQVLSSKENFNWLEQIRRGEKYKEELSEAILLFFAYHAVHSLSARARFQEVLDIGKDYLEYCEPDHPLNDLYQLASARLVLANKSSSSEELIETVASLGNLDINLQRDLLKRVTKEGSVVMQWIGTLWKLDYFDNRSPLEDELFQNYLTLAKALDYIPAKVRKAVIGRVLAKAVSRIEANGSIQPGEQILKNSSLTLFTMTKGHLAAIVSPETRTLFAALFYHLSRAISKGHSERLEMVDYAFSLVPESEEVLKQKISEERVCAYAEKSADAILTCQKEFSPDLNADLESLITDRIDPILRNFPEDRQLKLTHAELLFWKYECLNHLGRTQEASELKKTILLRLKGNFSHSANRWREKLQPTQKQVCLPADPQIIEVKEGGGCSVSAKLALDPKSSGLTPLQRLPLNGGRSFRKGGSQFMKEMGEFLK